MHESEIVEFPVKALYEAGLKAMAHCPASPRSHVKLADGPASTPPSQMLRRLQKRWVEAASNCDIEFTHCNRKGQTVSGPSLQTTFYGLTNILQRCIFSPAL